MLTSKDANGNITTSAYNALNLPRSTTLPGDASIAAYTVTNKYTKLGQPASQTDSLGKQSLVTYDNQGRTLTTTERTSAGAETITVTSRYDKAGNLRYFVDENGNTTEYTYDQLNRQETVKVTVKDINNVTTVCTTTNGYDANGNLTSVTDWRGNSWGSQFDALGRLIKTTDPYGTVTETLAYNKNNVQTHSTDAMGNVTEVQYDLNNRIKVTIDGEGNRQEQYYDAVGNVNKTIDGNGKITLYEFDNFNRLKQVKNAINELTKFSYDNNGNRLTQRIISHVINHCATTTVRTPVIIIAPKTARNGAKNAQNPGKAPPIREDWRRRHAPTTFSATPAFQSHPPCVATIQAPPLSPC